MFAKISKNKNFYINRGDWIWELNEDNLNTVSRFKIRKLEKKYSQWANAFIDFKYLVFWRWVEKHYVTSERFILRFHKNLNKLKLKLSSNEEKFINDLEEYIFNSWRPLKYINVKFSLDHKEEVKLYQSNVNLLLWDDKEKKSSMIGNYNVFYSNKRIFFCKKNQKINFITNLEEIKSLELSKLGVFLKLEHETYLLRSSNKILPYVLITNICPYLKVKNKENIKYFDKNSFSNIYLKIFN